MAKKKKTKGCRKHWWSVWAPSKFTWNGVISRKVTGRFCRECGKAETKPVR